MKNIQVLDCTLRDGGYINNWGFGRNNIKEIIAKLTCAKIDIIECGFLVNQRFNRDCSVFNCIENIAEYIYPKKKGFMYVAMLKLGQNEMEFERISDHQIEFIDGIRIVFKENEIDKALDYAKKLSNKGYKVFMHPAKTNLYEINSLLDLIVRINDLNPYAFYIVDTFGSMNSKDVLNLFKLIDDNLNEKIKIGFHSHNNLELSFANAKTIIDIETERKMIIDSSISGMGRGAGNLSTELFAKYLNDNVKTQYEITHLRDIYDEYLAEIFEKTPWGASPNYRLSAIYNCHPDYASFLIKQNVTSSELINNLFEEIPLAERKVYNESIICDLLKQNLGQGQLSR